MKCGNVGSVSCDQKSTIGKWAALFLSVVITLTVTGCAPVVNDSTPLVPSTAAASAMQTTAPAAVSAQPSAEAKTVPLKSMAVRFVVKDAGIDVTIDRLPMDAEQIAQRIYEAPVTPIGYLVQFKEGGKTFFDVPGSNMSHATFIIGHSCPYNRCVTDSGQWLPKQDWPLTRLADETKVKQGTKLSVFTGNGEVCASVTAVHHVGRYDAAAQDEVLRDAARRRAIVINTCDTFSEQEGVAALVVAGISPCGGD